MKSLFHQLEAGVFFMFLATLVSWGVILYEIGLGLTAIWIFALVVVYFVGVKNGADRELRRQFELDHKISQLRPR